MRQKQPNPRKCRRRNRTYSHDALVKAYQEVVENNMSVRRAAHLYNVPRTTIRDRLSGRVHPDTVTTGRPPIFSMFEEAKLVNHIKTMASYGYGYTRQETVNLAFDFAIQLGKRSKTEHLTFNWLSGFLVRWPELRVLKPRNLEYSRARMASQDTVTSYFENLGHTLVKHSLVDKPHLIFNVDEKGVTVEHKPPYIVGSSSHCPPAVTSGRGKTVTILGCISASGNNIPPFFVFPGKRMNERLLSGKSPGSDGIVSDSGWSNQAVFRHYLMDHFIKYIPGHDKQEVLLILDGHKSHVSVGLIEWAKENGIIFFFLPPHTSHILQPLDVSCYGPFERIFNAECHKLIRQTEATLTIYNVCEVACRVYTKALSPENAQSGFRRTGIYPLNQDAIPAESLIPAEVYTDGKAQEPDDNDSQATVEGGIEVNETTDMFTMKENRLLDIKSEKQKTKRRTISNIVAGNEVTDDVITKMKVHEISTKKKSAKSVGKKKPVKSINNTKKKNIKKVPPVCESPKPGPSHINLIPDSSSCDSGSDDEQTLCCVCNKFTPVELSRSVSLVFTKWAQCDGMKNGIPCLHWVHLIYCSPVRVVRRNDTFLCPHCVVEE